MLRRLFTPALPERIRRVLLALVIAGVPAVVQTKQSPPAPTNPISADASRPTVRALRVAEAPLIDGRLADDAWADAPVAEHFLQRDPDEGQPATERTEIRVLYDDDALVSGRASVRQ